MRVADNFPSIRARLRELARQPDPPCSCAYVERDGHRLRISAAGCPVHEGRAGAVHEAMAADRGREKMEGRPETPPVAATAAELTQEVFRRWITIRRDVLSRGRA